MMSGMQTRANQDKSSFTLCVYCGSRPGQDPAHAALAREVGRWIGENGARLVYGGGHHGLMGLVADAALEAGAHVTGVIPQALVELEAAHGGCSELHVVTNMHERKHLMAERADAFLALPGGIGTFEELFEVWTWRQLGYHDKPIGLLNAGGYYDGLLTFLRSSVQAGFMGDWQMELLRVSHSASELLPALLEAARPGAPDQLAQI